MDPSNGARASSSAGPLNLLLCPAMHQIARVSLVFSRLVNTAISRAPALPLIKPFIARFQGHCDLANARAYRLMEARSKRRSTRASCAYFLDGASSCGGFFDGLHHGTYGPVDYPAPLA